MCLYNHIQNYVYIYIFSLYIIKYISVLCIIIIWYYIILYTYIKCVYIYIIRECLYTNMVHAIIIYHTMAIFAVLSHVLHPLRFWRISPALRPLLLLGEDPGAAGHSSKPVMQSSMDWWENLWEKYGKTWKNAVCTPQFMCEHAMNWG